MKGKGKGKGKGLKGKGNNHYFLMAKDKVASCVEASHTGVRNALKRRLSMRLQERMRVGRMDTQKSGQMTGRGMMTPMMSPDGGAKTIDPRIRMGSSMPVPLKRLTRDRTTHREHADGSNVTLRNAKFMNLQNARVIDFKPWRGHVEFHTDEQA